MMDKDERMLVVRIKQGDKTAFKKLYEQYHKQLFFVAKKYLKDEDFAKDAVQDIYLKLWNKRKDLDESASIRNFMFTILRNHVLNIIRDEKNHRKILKELQQSNQRKFSRNSTEEEIIYSEYEAHVEEALKKLSPAKRKVFKMRNFYGMSNAEVAGERGVSVNTVKTQFYLGSRFIRNYLKNHVRGIF